jgi:thioredoxin-related protein
MTRILSLAVALLMTLGYQTTARAERPATEGAKVGEWTMDFDAAKKLAKAKNLPILMNFTGSDWCGWCKLMDKNVFSTEAWRTYATQNVVTVYIDFPKDKTLVPEKLVERNKELSKKFKVRGYPTYILLASDGEKQIGQLGASKTATAESFIKDLQKQVDIQKKIAKLPPKDKAEYDKVMADVEVAEKEMQTWIETRPKKNEENDKKHAAFVKRMHEFQEALDAIIARQK